MALKRHSSSGSKISPIHFIVISPILLQTFTLNNVIFNALVFYLKDCKYFLITTLYSNKRKPLYKARLV